MKRHLIDSSIALPWVWMNGRYVRSHAAKVSVFDKGFQVGDSVFDTVRVLNGCPLHWPLHWKRFSHTARQIGIKLPLNRTACHRALQDLLKKNRVTDAIARFQLTRGIGPRGYSPSSAKEPTLILTLHTAPRIVPGRPDRWQLGISSFRFPNCPWLTRHKTTSRLPQVMAKLEADARGFDDAILLNEKGHVTEAISSNVFWLHNGVVHTPPLTLGVLPGTTRELVLRLCKRMNIATSKTTATVAQLTTADAVFLSVSTKGIIEVVRIGRKRTKTHPLVADVHRRLEESLLKAAERFSVKQRGATKQALLPP